MGYASASIMLLKKNILLSIRDSGSLAVTLASTFVSMLILYFSQLSIDNSNLLDPSSFENRNPIPEPLSTIPRCVPVTFDDCLTLAFVPSTNPRVVRWVNQVSRQSNIPDREVRGFETDDQLNSFLFANPNRTQAAYIFDPDSLDQIDQSNVQFIVQYNDSNQSDFPLGSTDFHTSVVLPNMIHAMNLILMPEISGRSLNFNLTLSVFPHPNIVGRNASGPDQDAFGRSGPLLLFAVYFLALVFFLYKIVDEKERGLRAAMKLAGQLQSMHYLSWSIPYVLMNLVLTILLIAFGHTFRFNFFTANSFSVYFLTMFIFGLSLIGWTMLMSAITRRAETVSSIAFVLFVLCYTLATSGSVVYLVDEDGVPLVADNVIFLRQLFAIVPSTMFVKSIQDATKEALIGRSISLQNVGTYTNIFPIRECWFWMMGSGFVTYLIAIYLDNVLPSRHSARMSPLYMFSARYWGFGQSTEPVLDHDMDNDGSNDGNDTDTEEGPLYDGATSYDPGSEDPDVHLEREAVARGDRDSAALVIKNISKKFGNFLACDDLSFSVRKNTAFALMGGNGAGKSTLFNMLVTSSSPTSGDAFVFGLSVRHDQMAVRKMLGVCPQFDIYWDKLTGAEHIEIFAALKGMTAEERKKEIETRLDDVQLLEKKNVFAGSYSGGMQRRLSVALSLTGDPRIILLDECTTGADPIVRRDLWGTIQRAKKGRVVFLITHSIAEAQHIAGHNNIGIMAKGRLRVLGKAIHLKNKFGAGYRVLAVLEPSGDVEVLKGALDGVCEGASVSNVSSGENGEILAEYLLPRSAHESQVLAAVQILQNEGERYKVTNYSLNSATLGEVFKSITSLSEDAVQTEDGKESGRRRWCFCF
eukprot:GFKZ01015212.1.p1 GENE.GFKZ01015212.1~~GFKZ01015212.1.p1  ORF type:complete len:867 (+),score=102.01 GFKZ01015212.1:295-2895(+)